MVLIQGSACNITHFELAMLLVWFVGGVADNGGWVPRSLGFSEQWNVGPCSKSFVGNLVMIGNVGLHLQEK
jgi:hypothetical protein